MSPARAESSGREPCQRKSPVPAVSIVDIAMRSCTLWNCWKGISLASLGSILILVCRSSSAFVLNARGGQDLRPVSVVVALEGIRNMVSGGRGEATAWVCLFDLEVRKNLVLLVLSDGREKGISVVVVVSS